MHNDYSRLLLCTRTLWRIFCMGDTWCALMRWSLPWWSLIRGNLHVIVHFGETLFVQGGQVGAKFEREGENWQEEEGEI